MIWKVVATALDPSSAYNQRYRLGEFFYTMKENHCADKIVEFSTCSVFRGEISEEMKKEMMTMTVVIF
jgi:hypothetical protein